MEKGKNSYEQTIECIYRNDCVSRRLNLPKRPNPAASQNQAVRCKKNAEIGIIWFIVAAQAAWAVGAALTGAGADGADVAAEGSAFLAGVEESAAGVADESGLLSGLLVPLPSFFLASR